MKSWPDAPTPDEGALVEGEWFDQAIRWQYAFLGAPDRWLVLGGRGAGKTRLGAEWVNGLVRGFAPFSLGRYGQIALVAETLGDAREVMIEGPSGIATIARGDRPRYEASRRRLVWPASGAVAQVFSAEDPDSLRGPQFEACWADARTIWASVVTVGSAAAAIFGIPVGGLDNAALTDSVLQAVTAVSGIVAIFGRLGAVSRIG